MSLPSLLGRVAAHCGEDVAFAIGERLGGTDMVIRKRMTDRHPLRQILDQDTAAAVAALLGPGEHYIPAMTRYHAAERSARICAAAGTMPLTEIARKEGVTVRRVKQLLEAAR